MKTRLTLRPGDNGTKKLVTKYGMCLLAARSRYNTETRCCFKTMGLLEEELPWCPGERPKLKANARVLVRINYAETDLRERAKSVGALWQPDQRLWQMSYARARVLGLEGRIVS